MQLTLLPSYCSPLLREVGGVCLEDVKIVLRCPKTSLGHQRKSSKARVDISYKGHQRKKEDLLKYHHRARGQKRRKRDPRTARGKQIAHYGQCGQWGLLSEDRFSFMRFFAAEKKQKDK
ncbi:hypothetical protein EVAR_92032_1 [Eumeta japonica]|uniref:Uncharacterized protein n=1 Tax=Eumeta variegata TaxID=151549 RepID=A0A4C2A6N9_EUMVA|nr:hypothetical protein EVAR_92032_1 [Eumeta japonica]